MADTYFSIESRITEAVQAFHTRGGAIAAHLAEEFDVPVSRLRARLAGRQSRSQRIGSNRRLTKEQEDGISAYIKALDLAGVSARLNQVTTAANVFLTRTSPDNPPVSKAWTRRFLERRPELFLRKQKPLDLERAAAHDINELSDWYSRLKGVIDEFAIGVDDIWNIDETGFRVGVGRNQWIVTHNSARRLYLPSPQNRESLTVVEGISAAGSVVPPFIIVPGKMMMEKWFQGLEDNAAVALSDTGYMTDELALDYPKHFERFATPKGVYRLLLFDGYGSHCTFEFLEFCENHQIKPFCLLPHTNHVCQPLDVVVFQPYKHHHGQAVDNATRTGCSDFNKVEFLAALYGIRKKTFKPQTIRHAFREAGIVPFYPAVVINKVVALRAQYRPERTPSPRRNVDLSTPTTERRLNRQGDWLLGSDPTSDGFKARLERFVRGSQIQATTGTLATSRLTELNAANKLRQERARRARNTLQKGGILYSSQARIMKRRKVEAEEAQKERRRQKWKKEATQAPEAGSSTTIK